jgi:hypothetical protein
LKERREKSEAEIGYKKILETEMLEKVEKLK